MSFLWGKPKRRRTKKSRGKTAYRRGVIGETKATRFLKRRGYKSLVEGRLRTKAGEFDRIMRSPQGRKVAVEVKNLSSPVQAASVKRFGRKINQEKRHGMVSGGVMVSKSGYSPEAKKAARQHHIKLEKYAPPKKRRSSSLFGW
jgi:Holliday junction resolvase-like predicted endonuclease